MPVFPPKVGPGGWGIHLGGGVKHLFIAACHPARSEHLEGGREGTYFCLSQDCFMPPPRARFRRLRIACLRGVKLREFIPEFFPPHCDEPLRPFLDHGKQFPVSEAVIGQPLAKAQIGAQPPNAANSQATAKAAPTSLMALLGIKERVGT
jgi:hypothetical protein